jgi:hypothetical protein
MIFHLRSITLIIIWSASFHRDNTTCEPYFRPNAGSDAGAPELHELVTSVRRLCFARVVVEEGNDEFVNERRHAVAPVIA